MGPLLFVLFINDIVDVVRRSKIIKYADDTVLYTADQDIVIIEQNVSDDIEALVKWFHENELLLFNKSKKV